LQAGDVVIAREVRSHNRRFDASTSPLFRCASTLEAQQVGVALTVDEVVCSASDKRRLAASAAVNEVAWVDMESAAIAAVCDEMRVPYLIVRAISDRLNEDLPVDFNRCRDRSGRVSTRRVIQAALLRPRAFKGLIELKRRADLCASNLASFVERLLPPLSEMTSDE
jgi:adenosylhomocysteine nucleosidase